MAVSSMPNNKIYENLFSVFMVIPLICFCWLFLEAHDAFIDSYIEIGMEVESGISIDLCLLIIGQFFKSSISSIICYIVLIPFLGFMAIERVLWKIDDKIKNKKKRKKEIVLDLEPNIAFFSDFILSILFISCFYFVLFLFYKNIYLPAPYIF